MADGYGRAGELARQNGDCNKAIDLFTRALAEELPKRKILAIHVLRGYCYEDKGLYDEAISDFDTALRMQPDNQEALCGRGNAYLRKGHYKDALEDYNDALRLNPQFTDVYVNRGVAYKNMKMYDKAQNDFTQALSLNPNDVKALNNRGELYLQMGLFRLARIDYDELINLDPDSSAGFNGRGRTQFLLGDFSAAANAFDRAAKTSGNSLYNPIWRYLAEARMNVDGRDRLREAVADNATHGWPFPVVQYFLGDISREKVVEIADDADAQRRAGNRCEAFAYLAELDLAHGHVHVAQQQLQQAKEVCPTNFVEGDLVSSELQHLHGK